MPTGAQDPIELSEENLSVRTRERTTGRVRVRTETEAVATLATVDLEGETVEVTRVAIGTEIHSVPPIRHEGAVTILPVVEEVLVVEKRLVLKEEIHIRRQTTRERVEVPATLRRQRAVAERRDAETGIATEIPVDPRPADHSRPIQQRGLTMTMSDISSVSGDTLSAFFDSRAEAERALERLRAIGVSDAHLRLTEGAQDADGDGDRQGETAPRTKGFFEAWGICSSPTMIAIPTPRDCPAAVFW